MAEQESENRASDQQESAAGQASSPAPAGPAGGKGKPSGLNLQRKQILRTWVLFVVLIGVIVGLFEFLCWIGIPLGDGTSSATARITAGIMKLLGDDSVRVRAGNHITSDIFSVRIIFECTGLLNVFILMAAVLAFPSTWTAKLIGVAGGTLALLVANQVRLLTLVYIGRYMSAEAFDTFHIVFWQTLMIFVTLGIWLYWASKFVKPAGEKSAGAKPADGGGSESSADPSSAEDQGA